MQRISIVITLILILIVFYYYKPLKDIIIPEEKSAKSLISDKKSSDKESEFDELRVELYAITNMVGHLQGRSQLLKIAQENRDWFNEEEYVQLPTLLAKTEKNLKKAELEYEKIKDEYARKTVIRIIKESLNKGGEERTDSLE